MNRPFILTLVIFTAIFFAACSGNKSESTTKENTDQTEAVETAKKVNPADMTFDVEGINALMQSDDLSSKQIDFLLDQCEILVAKSEGMTSKQYRQFFSSLPSNEQEALLIVGMGLSSAEKNGKFSDSQLKRYKNLEARAPFGKK